jgi:hypothetical protein
MHIITLLTYGLRDWDPTPSAMPVYSLLTFYGLFLITCGIVSVIFIGLKAKTALMSGGMSGAFALGIAYWSYIGGYTHAHVAGILLTFALFVVFAWRSTKTLFKVFELIPSAHPDLKGKGIAFLIISLMAVTSIFIFSLLVITL